MVNIFLSMVPQERSFSSNECSMFGMKIYGFLEKFIKYPEDKNLYNALYK